MSEYFTILKWLNWVVKLNLQSTLCNDNVQVWTHWKEKHLKKMGRDVVEIPIFDGKTIFVEDFKIQMWFILLKFETYLVSSHVVVSSYA